MAPITHTGLSHTQNFLKDPRLVDVLLDRSTIGSDDLVLEIGPGKGIITERLAARAARVLAIEKDPRLAAHLARRFAGQPQVTLCAGDFLDARLPAGPYKVFASIPFDITAAIVARLTRGPNPPCDAYLVVQREAAERFTGRPRGTLAATLLWPWFAVEQVYRFRRSDFAPPPGVDVVLIRIAKRGPPLVTAEEAPLYRDLVSYLYTAWQPSMDTALTRLLGRRAAASVARAAEIDPAARPSTLPPDRWVTLMRCVREMATPSALTRVAGAERRLRRGQTRIDKRHRTAIRRAPRLGRRAPVEPRAPPVRMSA